MVNQNMENLNGHGTNTMDIGLVLEWKIRIRFQSYRCNRGSQGFDPKGGILSYPRILAKSNSDDLWTSLVSSPELHSNKSLCQESDHALFH